MKLKPLGDRIVVKPKDEDEATTTSGLVIPDTAKEKPQLGEVLAVGPGEFSDGYRVPRDGSAGQCRSDCTVLLQTGGRRPVLARRPQLRRLRQLCRPRRSFRQAHPGLGGR